MSFTVIILTLPEGAMSTFLGGPTPSVGK